MMIERAEPRYPYNRPVKGKLLTVVLILVFVAVGLLLAGYLTPGWYIIKYRIGTSLEVEIKFGLWYGTVCVNDECESGDLYDLTDTFNVDSGKL